MWLGDPKVTMWKAWPGAASVSSATNGAITALWYSAPRAFSSTPMAPARLACSDWAAEEGRYPSRTISACTRSSVSGATRSGCRSTLVTVCRETRAASATVLTLTRPVCRMRSLPPCLNLQSVDTGGLKVQMSTVWTVLPVTTDVKARLEAPDVGAT